MKNISANDVQFVKKSADVNKLFLYQGSLFRLIAKSEEQGGRWANLNRFIKSKEFSFLMESRWVPRLTPTDLAVEGWPGEVYRVEEVPFCTQNTEHTLLQKVEALKLICKINKFLLNEGSEEIANDCNLGQVSFYYTAPMFLDVGGFSCKNKLLAKGKFSRDFERVAEKLGGSSAEVLSEFDPESAGCWGGALDFLCKYSTADVIQCEAESVWDGYGKNRPQGLADIFMRRHVEDLYLLGVVSRLPDVGTLFDAGSSNGRLSLMFAAHGVRVLSADNAKRPLSELYSTARDLGLPITVCFLNLAKPIEPVRPPDFNEFDVWGKRLKADLVLASSITHHLYRAGLSFSSQAVKLGGIASKYLLIEYIDSEDKHVKRWGVGPDYSRDEFLSAFTEDWTLVGEGNPVQADRTWFLFERKVPLPHGRDWFQFSDPDR